MYDLSNKLSAINVTVVYDTPELERTSLESFHSFRISKPT